VPPPTIADSATWRDPPARRMGRWDDNWGAASPDDGERSLTYSAGVVRRTCRATGSVAAQALLGPERAYVADQGPPVVLGQMLPGGHRSAARSDLPENLAVGFSLHFLRCPVGGLGVKRSRCYALPPGHGMGCEDIGEEQGRVDPPN
jgi:hypothetical protein